MMTSTALVGLTRNLTSSTLTVSQLSKHRNPVRNPDHQPGNNAALIVITNEVEARPLTTHSERVRGKVIINDNYSVMQRGFVEMGGRTDKYVKGVSCVDQLSSIQSVSNVPNVGQNLPAGTRHNQFWKTWATLRASSKVIRILKEGYTLPFRNHSTLTSSPIIISGYVHPLRNSYLMEALYALIQKNAVEMVPTSDISGFLQQTFLGSKWVTSTDFKDAYFHIPINPQSYQFEVPLFGLSTAPMEQ